MEAYMRPTSDLVGLTPCTIFENLFTDPVECIFSNMDHDDDCGNRETSTRVFLVYAFNHQYTCFDYELDLNDPINENDVEHIYDCFFNGKYMTEYPDCQMFKAVYDNLCDVERSLYFQSQETQKLWTSAISSASHPFVQRQFV